ncbi:MAG: hypothetical protein LBP42_04785, partial [Treponema sp.]|nr:hypothetical protein [Treponema sp.]
FDIEILYRIVDIHKAAQEYTEMENRALEILEGASPDGSPWDSFWSEDSFTRNAMARILENDGVERFLTLYRYRNAPVERIHRILGFYYYASGRHSRAAEHLMFAFLIQNTTLIEEAIRSQYDFAFSSLETLMDEIMGRSQLAVYIEDVEYYKTVYYLGAALYGSGKAAPAGALWAFLGGQDLAGEWRGRAQRQLRNPFVERVQEMP